MQLSLIFIRTLFLSLCVLFLTTYAIADATEASYYTKLGIGIIGGLVLGCAIIGFEKQLRQFNLRAFNTATFGLFFGYIMGEAILFTFQPIIDLVHSHISAQAISTLRIGISLLSSYLGMAVAMKAADELYLSIPFVKFKSTSQKKKDFLIDLSVLIDPRIVDLAASGFLDHHLVIPRFLVKDLYEMCEHPDENIKSKARRSLDIIKKLETIATLDLRYAETDFPEIKDPMAKLIRLARLLDANILISDANRIQQPSLEGIRLINLHTLSSALKPIAQAGEYINIKIQRYGKEPRQGVGYLDDGTMVVVNGGAEYIGEGIRAQVLSVKHTSSGRMVFCNAVEDPLFAETAQATLSSFDTDNLTKNYYSI